MAFADVSDIENRWRELTTDEQDRASVLIDDASAMLAAQVEIDAADTAQIELLKIVTCSMVIRAMSATEADSYGANSMTMTAGPYSQSWNYSNPTGDMYLTKYEKKLLGITSGYIGTIRPKIGCDYD